MIKTLHSNSIYFYFGFMLLMIFVLLIYFNFVIPTSYEAAIAAKLIGNIFIFLAFVLWLTQIFRYRRVYFKEDYLIIKTFYNSKERIIKLSSLIEMNSDNEIFPLDCHIRFLDDKGKKRKVMFFKSFKYIWVNNVLESLNTKRVRGMHD